MTAYYNEIDPFASAWLGNLTAAGHLPQGRIDTRSIAEVQPEEVAEAHEAHFFAGIGGWPLALRLAGWPATRPVWTGSAPCQPFSTAGSRRGTDDERHLWPEFARLIRACRPPTIFGEQVASPDALAWLDAVFDDLEGAGYACWAADLCASSVGAPHIRQRLYWVAYADGRQPRDGGLQRRGGHMQRASHAACAPWSALEWLPCLDGKLRPTQPGLHPLAPGLPLGLGRLGPGERERAEVAGLDRRSLKEAKTNRIGRLRGYGNAIVPELAAAFVRAAMDVLELRERSP